MPDAPDVLVLERNRGVAMLLRDALGAAGITTALHRDAPSALAAARARPPRLILAATARERTLGTALVRRYRAMPGPHAPVILLTDDLAADDLAAEPPVVQILPKPFTVDALRAAVRPYLAAPPRGRGP